ncbi:MAG: amidohydrolase family protein [Angelakisella sp.]
MDKLLLKGGTLIDEKGMLSAEKDILITQGKIAEIAHNIICDDAEQLDCTGKYITSGFAVLHAHSPMHILRGLAEDVHIDDWFNTEIFPYESRLVENDIYLGARLCVAEMLDCGVTAFADHYFGAEQVARAITESGIKGDIAVTAFGFGGDASGEIAETRRLLEKYSGNPRVHIRFGPHSPYLCTPHVMKQLVEAARECGVGIHLHISETQRQVEDSYRDYGKSPFGVAADSGCFTLPCIAAHGLWTQESDLKLMAQDTFVAVCPKTYLKLGMGQGELWKLWERVNLCIGTDGAASSNSVDPLEQLRLFGLLGKWEDRAREFTLAELWGILMNGHNALGFNSGKLQAGYAADLNIWDLDTPATAPVYNPLAAIIYSAHPRTNILHTLVDGKFVKRDGKLLTDTASLLGEVKAAAAQIIARGKGESEVKF